MSLVSWKQVGWKQVVWEEVVWRDSNETCGTTPSSEPRWSDITDWDDAALWSD